jgi:hypothetical protein
MRICAILLSLAASAVLPAIPDTPGWHQIPNTKLADVCACTKGAFIS